MYSSIVIKGARGNFFFSGVQGDKKSEKESRKNLYFLTLY